MGTNTMLLIAAGVFLLWLGVTGKLKNIPAAWKTLLGTA